MQFDIHLTSPARLAILAALVPGSPKSFTELREETGLADGNLHVQTSKLKDVGYIERLKDRRGGRACTLFRITEEGLARFKLHVRKLQTILETESGVIAPRTGRPKGDASQVWSR